MPVKYTYLWEYYVKENRISEFEQAYGSKGDWVKLFKKAEGYLGTELHKDINNASRYITIDYWKSKEACLNFRDYFHEEFEKIDKKCEAFTTGENPLGEFEIID